VVVHPSRDIDEPLHGLFGWAEREGVSVVQVPVVGQDRAVAEPGAPGDCDLLVSIGGDGTMLAAIRAGVAAQPGLAVCGAAFDGIGIPACIGTARSAAEHTVSYLRDRSRPGGAPAGG